MYFEELTHDRVSLAFSAKIHKKFVTIFKENKIYTSVEQYRNRQHGKICLHLEAGERESCHESRRKEKVSNVRDDIEDCVTTKALTIMIDSRYMYIVHSAILLSPEKKKAPKNFYPLNDCFDTMYIICLKMRFFP